MPVKKKTTKKRSTTTHDCCFDRGCGIGMTPNDGGHAMGFAHKILLTLVGVLLAYFIVWIGTLIRNNIEEFQYIGMADQMERTITVDGSATVSATPDVAKATMGTVSEGATIAEAQEKNTASMNDLISKLKEMGVADPDIQTQNYNVYPLYDYSLEEGRELYAYEVNQNVDITIRDLDKADQIIALAGVTGANIVSGLSFEIDDPAAFESEARDEAIKDAFTKAKDLSNQLGVTLMRISNYSEYVPSAGYPSFYDSYAAEAYAYAGSSPSIEPGTTDVNMEVSITFEIR